ncbi:copper resistance CopC family protein [Actinomycetes bacterium KLBMP 9797]
MTRYRLLCAAVATMAAMAAVAVPTAPAQAHTELKSTSPAAKSTTAKPVAAVTLTFTGLIKRPGTTVVVTGPDKVSYSTGDAQVLDKTITQKVNPLPVGAITVAWRTVAADGHPMQGSFRFTNQAAPATPSAKPTPTADAAPTTPPATVAATPTPLVQAGGDGSSSALWWVVAAVAALALTLLGGLLWRRRRPAST